MARKVSATKSEEKSVTRRGFFRNFFMLGGLGLSYGSLLWYVLRYLAPPGRNDNRKKIFVARIEEVERAGSYEFVAPDGESYVIAPSEDGEQGFTAFSSTCPHLGCKIFWQQDRSRYFCPCHNGVFDPSGNAIEGPPYKSGKNLKRLPVVVEGKALYAMVKVTEK